MSEASQGPGWWLASDGRWYPPQAAETARTTGAIPPPGPLSLILNIVWILLSGFWLALAYAVVGIVLCLLIVTIPFGVQCFKLAGFVLWPFGRAVVAKPSSWSGLNLLGNLIWVVAAGFWMAAAHLVTGLFLCLTVIGIPLGVANFKLVPLVLFPFGKEVVRRDQVYGRAVAF